MHEHVAWVIKRYEHKC